MGLGEGVCVDPRVLEGCLCRPTGRGGGVSVDPWVVEGCLCVTTGRGGVSQRYVYEKLVVSEM